MPEVKATARAESWVDEAGRHWHRSAEGYWWWWAGDHWEHWTPQWSALATAAGQRRKRRIIIWTAVVWNILAVLVVPSFFVHPTRARCGNDCGSEAIIGWVLLGVFLIGDLIMWLAWPRRQRLTP